MISYFPSVNKGIFNKKNSVQRISNQTYVASDLLKTLKLPNAKDFVSHEPSF